MKAYRWPGNVRELRNAVHRAAILCPGGEIQVEHLPPSLRGDPGRRPEAGGVFIPTGTALDAAEKAIILETLRALGGNKTRTAEVLGISLKTLYNRLNVWEAEVRANGGT
jgi:DNA-binding NtrC family response regulator